MAKMPNGILGSISGKIGPIVASDGKYGPNIRSIPRQKKDDPSEAQKAQRAKFALASAYLTPMRGLLLQSYANDFLSTDPFKTAVSYTIKNAVRGSYPGYYIDPSLVWMSYGHQPPAAAPAVSSPAPGQLLFNWTDNSGQGKAGGGDKAILIAYCREKKSGFYLFGGAERQAGSDVLEAPLLSGRTVSTWLGFIARDEKDIAPGIYAGEVTVL